MEVFKIWANERYNNNDKYQSHSPENLAYQLASHCRIYENFEIIS
jgi:hypothetical protein